MEMQRYLDAGCILAENLGKHNDKLNYTGTALIDSPYGKARRFNGNGDYVSCSVRELNLNNSDFTIVARIYLVNNTTQSKNRICKLNNTFTFGIDKNTRKLGSFINIGDSPTGSWTDGPIVDINNWIDVAIVWNNTARTKSYYVNGIFQNTVNVAVTTTSTSDGLITIGGNAGAFNHWFGGNIKELIVEKRQWHVNELLNYTQNNVFDYDKNIISRWNLDDTTSIKDLGWKDLGNNGTVNGNPTIDDNPFGGKCLNFDGTGDYISISNSIPLNNTVTASCWFRTSNSFATDSILVGKYNLNDRRSYLLYIIGSTNKLGFNTSNTGKAITNTRAISIASVNDGKWHHAVGVHDGNFNYVYLDGILAARVDAISGIYESSCETTIGNILNNTTPLATGWFVGCISKVVVFNKPLTQLEIKDLFNRTRREL